MKQTTIITAVLFFLAAPAEAGQQASIDGLATNVQGTDPLQNFPTHLRDVATGELTDETIASVAGRFTFRNLPTGTYVVEVGNGKVLIGKSSPITIGNEQPIFGVIIRSTFASTKPLSGIGPWPYLAMIGAHAWDFDSTRRAKRRGARELNGLIRSNMGLLAIKIISSIVNDVFIHNLDLYARRHGSTRVKRLSLWLSYGTAAANIGFAVSNEQVMK